MLENVEQHTFTAKLDCRYVLHVPPDPNANSLLVLTLHGYSSNPTAMLNLTAGLVGVQHIIAALQAPHPQYVSQGLPAANSATGYNWGVRVHWGSAVRLHHDMVLEVLSILRGRFDLGPERCLLAGFSQPVGLNYRFAGTWPDQVRGVIGICGGVPKDWEEDKYRPVAASILHIAREEDEFFPPSVTSQFAERLRKHASDVEFQLLPGGHRFPSKARHVVAPWLSRVFGEVAVGSGQSFTSS